MCESALHQLLNIACHPSREKARGGGWFARGKLNMPKGWAESKMIE